MAMYNEIMTEDEYLASENDLTPDVRSQFDQIEETLGDVGMRLGIFSVPATIERAPENAPSGFLNGSAFVGSSQDPPLNAKSRVDTPPAYAIPASLTQLLRQRDSLLDFKVLPAIADLRTRVVGLGKYVSLTVLSVDTETLLPAVAQLFHKTAPHVGYHSVDQTDGFFRTGSARPNYVQQTLGSESWRNRSPHQEALGAQPL